MRILGARVHALALPLRAALPALGAAAPTRCTAILELESESGVRGFGESAPLPSFGSEPFAESLRWLTARSRELIGQDVATAEARPWPSDATVGAEPPCAAGALAWALLDLEARAAGEPLAARLARETGIEPRAWVTVNALLDADLPDEDLAKAAVRSVAAGFRAVKLKLARTTVAEQVRRVATVRAAVGPDVALRLDANGALEEDAALDLCRAVSRYAPEYLEQPVAPAALESLARVRRASPIPIAADESAVRPGEARRVLELEAADLLILKPALCGGPRAALEIASRAREAGVPVVVTSALESAIGRSAALQLAAALPSDGRASGLATGTWLLADVCDAGEPVAGELAVPARPGLGIEPYPERLSGLRLRGSAGEKA